MGMTEKTQEQRKAEAKEEETKEIPVEQKKYDGGPIPKAKKR